MPEQEAPPHVFIHGVSVSRKLDEVLTSVLPSYDRLSHRQENVVRIGGINTADAKARADVVYYTISGVIFLDTAANATELGLLAVPGFVKMMTNTRDVFGARKVVVVHNVHLLGNAPMMALKRIVEKASFSAVLVFTAPHSNAMDTSLLSRFHTVTCGNLDCVAGSSDDDERGGVGDDKDDDLKGETSGVDLDVYAKQLVERISRLKLYDHLLGVKLHRVVLQGAGPAPLFHAVIRQVSVKNKKGKEHGESRVRDLISDLARIEHSYVCLMKRGSLLLKSDPNLLLGETVFVIKKAVG